jgi:protein-disulfide isomerase
MTLRPSLIAAASVLSLTAFTAGALAGSALFRDVPADHWAAGAISRLQEAGVLKGSDGLFRPNDDVSRAELAVVLDRLVAKLGLADRLDTAPSPVPEDVGVNPPRATGLSLGDSDAPVTIVAFGDYECPFCKRFHTQTFPLLEEEYISTGKVRFVQRHLPLSFHVTAYPAATMVECARKQGASFAWPLHDAFLSDDVAVDEDDVIDFLKTKTGFNEATFSTCLDATATSSVIDRDIEAAAEAGVNGTPGFWVLGPAGQAEQIQGAVPYGTFSAAIEKLLP